MNPIITVKRSLRTATALCLLLATAACAGRAPAPVPVVQVQDRAMDCSAIVAETQANAEKIRGLGAEEGAKTAQNIAAGVAGLFIPVLWFGMDFQNAAGKETVALQSRQQYLATLADQRQCGAPPPAGTVAAATR